MEVQFVTLGDAAERLDSPASTIRGWADKLEELGIHYLERNHRDERIFYDSDLNIFRYMKEQKDLLGRKTTTTDLAYVIADMFECRREAELPEVPKHKPNISKTDIEHVISHPDFQEFMHEIVKKATSQVSAELAVAITESVKQEFNSKLDEIELRRVNQFDEYINEHRRTQRMFREYLELPFWKRAFTKMPALKEE